MSGRDPFGPDADRALDEFLDAAGEDAESDEVTPPPFASVLARARRLDPSLLPPSPELQRTPGPIADEPATASMLRPFVEAARREADRDCAAQDRVSPPGLPRPLGSVPFARWAVVGGVVAVAAAIVLLFGLLDVRSVLRADSARTDNQALDQVERDRPLLASETSGDAPGPLRRPRGGLGTPSPSVPEPSHVLPDQPAPLEDVAPAPSIPEEPVPLDSTEPPPVGPDPKAAPERRREPRAAALRRLDERASSRLAAGDTAGAEKTYRALIRRGGKSTLAELAYGDLFTIAHGRGDRARLRALWRDYLDTFPRGRFSDDARAGLCRNAGPDERTRCWERYLDDFPTGAYHRQAERALSRE